MPLSPFATLSGLTLLLCVSIMRTATAQSQPLPPIVTKPHRNVCALPYTTVDICGSVNGTIDGYTGYEPEASRQSGTTSWGPAPMHAHGDRKSKHA